LCASVLPNRFKILFGTLLHCLVNSIWEQYLEQFLRAADQQGLMKISEQPREQFSDKSSIWINKTILIQVVLLVKQESLVCHWFYFCRFLLICQLEGLDLIFTLKWFFLWGISETLSQNRSENSACRFSKSDLQNMIFTIFGLTFFFGIFEINVQLVVKSKTVFLWKYCWKAYSYFILKIDFISIWFRKWCFSQSYCF